MIAPRRLIRWFDASVARYPDRVALEVATETWTYAELDHAANGIAAALHDAGLGPGRRVGLALPRGAALYLALLGIQKSGASYVPIDNLMPDARRRWLAEDAALDLLIGERPEDWGGACWSEDDIDRAARRAGTAPNLGDNPSDECYVLYTSGSTGLPKGVPITEGNICAFIEAALPIYAVEARDRVYQGVSLSFDFAIEELWPAWAAGATLVASERTPQPVGEELNQFLAENRISVLCAVPTVLSTLHAPWPELRQLVVSGEACPAELVMRWAKPGIRMLNAYGPTEITVTATIGELKPDEPVTLGHALPHLRLSVRNAELQELPDGEIGELCVAGSGVAARGYLNRPEQTAARFLPDPDGGGRMYRTGDLVSRMADGRFLYFGRADDQIKLRGRRIEPGEIESVLLSDPAIAQAAVVAWAPPKRLPELAAYVRLRSGHADTAEWRQRVAERLADRLHPALRPSLFDVVESWPELPNGKTDRRRLPTPTGTRLRAAGSQLADMPLGALGEQIRAIWQQVLENDVVPAEAHFFNDLGGHSMTAAVTVSNVRQKLGIGHVSVADLYRHPRLRDFAAHCRAQQKEVPLQLLRAEPPAAPRLWRWPCGLAQLGFMLLVVAFATLPGWWMVRALSPYSPLVSFVAAAAFMPIWLLIDGLMLPVAASFLIGPLRPGRYPLWGGTYLKFWIKRRLLQMAPARLLAGHRWWSAYLRLLGARIGPDGVIASAIVAVPELIEIGARVHIDADGALLPYRVRDGWLTLAPVVVGYDATIGCGAVMQAGAKLAAWAELAPQSALMDGDETRMGWRHVGNPARPDAARQRSHPTTGRTPSPGVKPLLLLLFLPTIAFLPVAALAFIFNPAGASLYWLAPVNGVVSTISLALVTILLVRLCLRRPLPRAIPLDGADYCRKWLADRAISLHQMGSHAVYDTVFTPSLLRGFGVSVGKGAELSTVSHFDPTSLRMGEFCFVADLAAVGVPHHADGHMHIAPTTIGNRAFVGNRAVLPAGSSIADGALLGAHSYPEQALVMSDCLGVPAFDLPKRERDGSTGEDLTFAPPLWRKAGRTACDLMRAWGPPTLLMLSYTAWFQFVESWQGDSGTGFTLSLILTVLLQLALVGVCMAAKWAVVGRYRPRVAPLWTDFVWRTQWITGWYEAIAVPVLLGWLTGTPWLAPLLRGFGCRIGRNVFLDTSFVTEFDLVCLEDDCETGEATALQTHLFEDRVMKCGIVRLEPGASVGARCVVLYGGTIGNGARLESLSLAMKAERLTEGTQFRGVPAEPAVGEREMPEPMDTPEPSPMRRLERSRERSRAHHRGGLLVAQR